MLPETAARTALPLPYGRRHQKGLNVTTTIAMTAFHAGALLAFAFVDAGAIFVAAILYCVAGMLGIGMAYHRLLTHRGYKTYKPIEYFLTWCGTLALEGGPIFWVATHRIHHQHSDREGDPHTPREGTWWAHAGWILSGEGLHHDSSVLARYVPDLMRDPVQVWLSRWHWTSNVTRRPWPVAVGWCAVRVVGHLPARHAGAPCDMAGELRDAQMGLAAVRDARRLHEQLVGRHADLRRRLAQQSSRSSDERSPRSGLVRARSELDRYPRAGSAWPCLGCKAGSSVTSAIQAELTLSLVTHLCARSRTPCSR